MSAIGMSKSGAAGSEVAGTSAGTPSLAGSLMAKLVNSPLARAVAIGSALYGTSEEALAQAVTNRPPAVGDTVTLVEKVGGNTVTNSFQVAVKPKGTNAMELCLVPSAERKAALQGPTPSPWANVPAVGSFITNNVPMPDGTVQTNVYKVIGEPVSRLAHVSTIDPAKRKVGTGDSKFSVGTLLTMPAQHSLVIAEEGVYQMLGTSTRADQIPDRLISWYPSFSPLDSYWVDGSQINSDYARGRVVYPVDTRAAGFVFGRRGDGFFSGAIDFTHPDVVAKAQALRPGNPRHFIVEGSQLVLTECGPEEAYNANIAVRVAASSTPASADAHGVIRNHIEGTGYVESIAAFNSNPIGNVCLGGVFVPLEKVVRTPQQISISVSGMLGDGGVLLSFSEALKYPAYLGAGYSLGAVGGGTSGFYPIAELPVGMVGIEICGDYLRAAVPAGTPGAGSMFYVLLPR